MPRSKEQEPRKTEQRPRKQHLVQPTVNPSIYLELTYITLPVPGSILPNVVTGIRYRNSDFKSMSVDTLARMIQGEFVEQLGHATVYKIIDCRYPYQFMDGHIMGALNLYSRHKILTNFPMEKETLKVETVEQRLRRRPCIYVFYCKFSLERAPKLLSFLRAKDQRREYTDLYVLQGGYDKFHKLHHQLCEKEKEPIYEENIIFY
ncbi:cdc25-like protein phosphatase twine [Drosophila serrata]|uniref:cdc25-like protein phosphatase twine n=1 Tax=Drosophila serrata TaxID=7274 RepID=UPI000A1D3537|nr:cdc25-like protein phosphatase twine [Drosophila serrata]